MCWKVLEREYLYSGDSYRAEKTLSHLRLLDWSEDNQQIVWRLVNSLKQGGPDFIFKRLALEMFSRFVCLGLWDKKTFPTFIPSPSRSHKTRDHAFQLTQALSFYFGGEVKNILSRRVDFEFQKTKTKRQRANVMIQSEKTISSQKTFVFVDDVLTTGATARAVFQALGRPKNFFIFTLAWRRLRQNHRL